MTKPCTNVVGCDEYAASLRRGQNTCAGCGANVGTITNAADQAIDSLVSRVDHVTPEHFYQLFLEAAQQYADNLENSGISVILQDAAFAITLRSIQIISDLREAISKHG